MTRQKNVILFILVICVFSCNLKVDSYGQYSIYRKLDDSLTFILNVDSEDGSYSYKSNIKLDLKTLTNYSAFFVDKNGAYSKYEMDGDCKIFPIKEADLPTFQVLDNSEYAKDKNHVYYFRNGIIDNADVYSFEVINGRAQDKNYLYSWGQIDTLKILEYREK